MDVVVPQDVALAVERRLVVVLADVVCLRQFIIVGRTVVAIVDDNIVLVAIDERRVGRHIARICLDRAIDRLDALARDREVGLLDRRALVEREGARVFETVVLLVLCAEAVERDNRVIRILGCILGDDAFRVARQCARTRDRQVACTVTVDARKDCLTEICFRAVDRRIRCVRDEVVDVVFRDVQRRDRCRAFEVRDVVVRQAVGTFAREVVVADFLRPLTARAVKRCIVRIVHATECRIQSLLRVAIRDAGCIVVTILRFVELRAIDRRRIANLNGQISFVNFKVTLRVDDFVVDTCTILEADIYHIDSIFIRIWASISRRTTILILSIAAAGFDGKVIGTLVELIAIDNRFARHAFLFTGERCGERPVVDGCVAVGLAAAAVDVDLASEDFDGAAILCSGIFIAACFTFVRQVIAFRSSFDVVNRLVIGFTDRCFIAARTRCGLCPAITRERAAAIVVVSYVAFVEGIRIFVDVMLFIILSGKGCLSGGRDIVIRQFLTVDFRHVVSGDINGRLYLEDVLVAIVRRSILVEAVRTIGVCMPLGVRAAVEVRAELIGIWRVRIDLPVAARASRDGFRCRRVIMEGTVRAASIDDNSIVGIRRCN